jgi:GNAT superfamily N-acetyltransferase
MIPGMNASSRPPRIDRRKIRVEPVAVDSIVDLRHQVLRQGLPREAALFDGDNNPSSLHFGAFDGHRLVGCVTLHASRWEEQSAWQLRGMAVAPEYRKAGVGGALLRVAEDHLSTDGKTRMLWCNARVPAAAFYQKFGWQIVSEVFEIPTAGPHVRMIKHC